MRTITYLLPVMLLALLPLQAVAGPISKFDGKKPDIEIVSSIGLFDLERCLTDMDGWPVPFIYRQPDKPNEVNILWVVQSTTKARAHLAKVDGGVLVRIWNADGNQSKSCVDTGRKKLPNIETQQP
jgi:hypothetical protein